MVSSFLRPLTTASFLSAAVAASAVSSQSPLKLRVHSSHFPVKHSHLYSAPLILASAPGAFKAVSNSVHPSTILHMESAAIDVNSSDSTKRVLPELLTEFMVDMTCEGCVSAVKNNIQKLDGVRVVDVDLSNQVVRVIGSIPVRTMLDAVEQTGRKARLIGQGNPNDFLVSAAVAEFKGPDIFGVVRLAQVNMELTRIEASFSGLSPGKHGWSINEYGDLTRGVASTGIVFDPTNCLSEKVVWLFEGDPVISLIFSRRLGEPCRRLALRYCLRLLAPCGSSVFSFKLAAFGSPLLPSYTDAAVQSFMQLNVL